MKKRGLANQILIVGIMGIVLGLIILVLFIWSVAAPFVTSTTNEINSVIQTSIQESNNTDLEYAAEVSLGSANSSIQQLEWVSYTIIILVFIVFLGMAFYVRTYPFLAWFWILIMLVLVALSIFLTVAYQDTATDAHRAWTNNNFIMSHLPHIIAVIGIIGGIVMFILASKDPEAEAISL